MATKSLIRPPGWLLNKRGHLPKTSICLAGKAGLGFMATRVGAVRRIANRWYFLVVVTGFDVMVCKASVCDGCFL